MITDLLADGPSPEYYRERNGTLPASFAVAAELKREQDICPACGANRTIPMSLAASLLFPCSFGELPDGEWIHA